MKLEIIEPSERHSGPILVCDEAHNDIAEFFHDEHATVGQSYETALALAQALVSAQGPALAGTFACPICGKDTPHHHTSEEIACAQPTVAGVIAHCRDRAKHLRKEGSMSLDAAADILIEIAEKLERVRPSSPLSSPHL